VGNIKYTSYSAYLNTLGGLINWSSYTGLPETQQIALKQYYDNNATKGWIASNWLAVCPNGEARFVGNLGQYPNNLANTTYWTSTAVTPTANSIANPADGRVTATRLLETAANSTHTCLQNYTFIPNATYQLTCYARAVGGRWLFLSANDGTTNYFSTFDVVNGVVGTGSSGLTSPSTITQTANGFWVCSIFFTAAATAGSGTFGPGMSTDGTSVSYAGDTSKGLYVWGNVLSQTTYAAPTALLIPNDQLGEEFIDAVFQVWQMSPIGAGAPVPQGYEMMPDGVQVIGTNAWVWNGWMWTFPTWYTAGWPVFLYYRKGKPSFTGDDYDASETYAVDEQILFTDSSGVQNFYKCIVATLGGQSPDTHPNSWQILQLPEFLFQYVCYAAFADYLRMDSQMEKALTVEALAQAELDRQHDREERQMAIQPTFRVQTHVANQARGWPSR